MVGLGNFTHLEARHNAGMQLVDYFADRLSHGKHRWDLNRTYPGWINQFGLPTNLVGVDKRIFLFKPKEYMNLSGVPVRKIMIALGYSPENILVIHDDLDLEFGKFKFKDGGSHGGHNGLRSIITTLSSKEFQRLHIGIGRPKDRGDVTSYVLDRFQETQANSLQTEVFPKAYNEFLVKLHNINMPQ